MLSFSLQLKTTNHNQTFQLEKGLMPLVPDV